MTKQYTVEWLEPSHGEYGMWYRSDQFDTLTMANARMRELIHTMREYGVKTPLVRVRSVTGRAPAMTPATESDLTQ